MKNIFIFAFFALIANFAFSQCGEPYCVTRPAWPAYPTQVCLDYITCGDCPGYPANCHAPQCAIVDPSSTHCFETPTYICPATNQCTPYCLYGITFTTFFGSSLTFNDLINGVTQTQKDPLNYSWFYHVTLNGHEITITVDIMPGFPE